LDQTKDDLGAGIRSARHRGAHPEDKRLFAPSKLDALCGATADLSYLLGRGYAMPSAIKVVGDRYTLHERQRLAVSRAACADAARERRLAKEIPATAIAGQPLIVDGFNHLITLEAALSGGVVLVCRDGCRRGVASVHGSYHSVEETTPALDLAAAACRDLKPSTMAWVLDQPVSNSGRLAGADSGICRSIVAQLDGGSRHES
jgi:hypothetical protein